MNIYHCLEFRIYSYDICGDTDVNKRSNTTQEVAPKWKTSYKRH